MTEEQLKERLQVIFYHLHDNPEISWEEIKTTDYLIHLLEEEGLKPKRFKNMTGLYVDIGKGEPKVGYRADMDALWQEIDGQFQANHSCGHDAHMTVAIGAILLLKEQAANLQEAVRFIFQPAEEKAQGAKALVKEGVVDPLQFLYGAHVRPLIELEDGKYAPALHHGAVKLFTGKIEGIEAHGARPEEGVNAIEVAAALVDGLKRIWIKPAASGSIKMTQLHAGGASANIIPANATFSIDVRAQTNETMDKLTSGFEKVVEALSALYEVSIQYSEDAHIAAANVDETAKQLMKQAIIDVEGEEHCAEEIITPGGEDFHFYAYSKPQLQTSMLGIGCGVTPGLHHPHMTFNKERLATSAKIVAQVLRLTLKHMERSVES